MTGLPKNAVEIMDWTWPQIEPFYKELAGRALSGSDAGPFLAEWSALQDRVDEVFSRLSVAKDANTADQEAEARFNRFLDEVYPKVQEAEQGLRTKLLASGLSTADFELPLKRMRTAAELFRQENLPLFVELQKLGNEYSKTVGSQTVKWDGAEVTVTQLRPVYHETNRERREAAWRLAMGRWLQDRSSINELWRKLLALRLKAAANAGFRDFRSFRWLMMSRFDYTPGDCRRFQDAIERAVVPAASRVYERRRRALGLATLRPWDLDVDPAGRQPLRPFTGVEEFRQKCRAILQNVGPDPGRYFETMIAEGLLDLENRKNKSPGGYCAGFEAARRPFIFMNAVGLHGDVQTLIHEAGHAVHAFEAYRLPYFQQRQVGLEFAEVASMGMELLAMPYLGADKGGFYTAEEAQRARQEHLESVILFWPYMAVVDAFQHWVYEHPDKASEPAECDATWTGLWRRFMPGIDYSGFDDVLVTGWHRKLHIHLEPFYYVEYGLAQLGACQIWQNALRDQPAAVAAYMKALALGGTRSLPDLFAAAGAKLAFDVESLGGVVAAVEQALEK